MVNSNTFSIGYDGTFELNEFNQPRIKSEIELVKDIVMYILFTRPGQYPSLPNIGLDIQSILYSFYDELNTEDLKEQIISQCEALDQFFRNGSIEVKKAKYKGHPSLMIHIEGKETYPDGYMKDSIGASDKYLIGITFNELDQMVYNISTGGV